MIFNNIQIAKYRFLNICCCQFVVVDIQSRTDANGKVERISRNQRRKARSQASKALQNQTRSSDETASTSRNDVVDEYYVPVTEFVDDHTDLGALLTTHFIDMPANDSGAFSVLLTGLHTCGDLAASLLRLYSCSTHVSVTCHVGCCYHMISERYLSTPGTESGRKNHSLKYIYMPSYT